MTRRRAFSVLIGAALLIEVGLLLWSMVAALNEPSILRVAAIALLVETPLVVAIVATLHVAFDR